MSACSTACSPSVASATTSRSGWALSTVRRPVEHDRVVVGDQDVGLERRHRWLRRGIDSSHLGPAAGGRLRSQRRADEHRALTHARGSRATTCQRRRAALARRRARSARSRPPCRAAPARRDVASAWRATFVSASCATR